jgi:transposase
MPFILQVHPHLTPEALVERFKWCKNAGERLRLQAVMLKSEGWSAKAISDICKRREDWVRRTVHVYNDGGPEALADGRRDNGRERVLGVVACEQLSAALLQPPPDGGLWTSPKVSAWIEEHHGLIVSEHTAWAYMVRTGHRRQVPRPKHPDADLEAQEAFKKGGFKVVFETSFEPTPTRKSRSGRRTKGGSG